MICVYTCTDSNVAKNYEMSSMLQNAFYDLTPKSITIFHLTPNNTLNTTLPLISSLRHNKQSERTSIPILKPSQTHSSIRKHLIRHSLPSLTILALNQPLLIDRVRREASERLAFAFKVNLGAIFGDRECVIRRHELGLGGKGKVGVTSFATV